MTSLLLRCSAQSLRQAPRAGLRRAAAQLWGGTLASRMLLSTRHGAAAAAVEAVQAEAPPAGAQQASGPAEPPAFRAFIDFRFVRDTVEAVAANCRNRLSTADPHLVAQLYEEYVKAQQETDRLRAARNENSSAMKVGRRRRCRQCCLNGGLCFLLLAACHPAFAVGKLCYLDSIIHLWHAMFLLLIACTPLCT